MEGGAESSLVLPMPVAHGQMRVHTGQAGWVLRAPAGLLLGPQEALRPAGPEARHLPGHVGPEQRMGWGEARRAGSSRGEAKDSAVLPSRDADGFGARGPQSLLRA